jgi:hypothetical protein
MPSVNPNKIIKITSLVGLATEEKTATFLLPIG